MKISPKVEQAILERKKSQPAVSNRALAAAFNVHHSVVERVLSGGASTEFSEMTKDTWSYEAKTRQRITTLEELVVFCKIDLLTWDVERWQANSYEMAAKDADGELRVEPLYQIKAFMRKKKNLVTARQEIEDLKELAKSYAPPARVPRKPAKLGQYCLELACVDHHFGKLGWSTETGYESYDLKIAEKIYWDAFYSLLDRTKHYTYEESLIVVGNDLLHADSPKGTTTKGTPVSCDGRYQKVFQVVRDVMIKSIEELRKISGKVNVYLVAGNHDSDSIWSLGSSLECFFHFQPDVVVNNLPRTRKYFVYGDNLLLLTHGHTTKTSQLPLLMATENPHDFGKARFKEAHVGHRHTRKGELVVMQDLIEDHGVRVRTLPALTGVDDWHASNGYVGNLRQSDAFVWSRTEGIISVATYTHIEESQ